MSKSVRVIQPNPIVTQGIAEFCTPQNMFRENRSIVILPDSMVRQDKTCLGTVGFINEDFIYPYILFGDIGCGVGALIIDEDVELPDNVEEIISQVLKEPYFEPTEQDDLGIDTSVYTGNADEIELALAQQVNALQRAGSNDVYLTSSLIGGKPLKASRVALSANSEGGEQEFQSRQQARLNNSGLTTYTISN